VQAGGGEHHLEPFDDVGGPRSCLLEVAHGDHGQLCVADPIVGKRRHGAGGFTDEQEQLDRHAGPLGRLRERLAAERREPLERGGFEEVERDLTAPDGRAQPSTGMPASVRFFTSPARRRWRGVKR